jgi:PBP1b-binding outer membrane lipoprotein LpoB
MKYKQLAIIAVVVLIISGCVEEQYKPDAEPAGHRKSVASVEPVKPENSITTFKVKIISEPSGAVIEINNNYMGKTPMTEQKGSNLDLTH